jgi:hypothetical protein
MNQSFQASLTNSSGVTSYTTTVPTGKAPGNYTVTFTATKTGYANSATLSRTVTVSTPTLDITSITPAATQRLAPGEGVWYTITVLDGVGRPVSGVVVGGTDNLISQSLQTAPTDGSGQTTYLTMVPSGKPPATYSITFTASKVGYTSSPAVSRSVTVVQSGVLTYEEWPSVTIPDNGGFNGRIIRGFDLSGAPSGAVVYLVDVQVDITHSYIGDLQVWFTTEASPNVWIDGFLHDRTGGSQDNINVTYVNLPYWSGLSPNRRWYLVAADYVALDEGTLDHFKAWVRWRLP